MGFVRLSSNPSFTRHPATPRAALELWQQLIEVGKHVFWDRMPPVSSLSALPLAGHQQLNDALLVKTAELHRGALVTFDRACAAHDLGGKRVIVLDPGR